MPTQTPRLDAILNAVFDAAYRQLEARETAINEAALFHYRNAAWFAHATRAVLGFRPLTQAEFDSALEV